jgi:hypothetical protein
MDVAAADSASLHPYEHLVRRDLRIGHLFNAESAVTGENESLHGVDLIQWSVSQRAQSATTGRQIRGRNRESKY